MKKLFSTLVIVTLCLAAPNAFSSNAPTVKCQVMGAMGTKFNDIQKRFLNHESKFKGQNPILTKSFNDLTTYYNAYAQPQPSKYECNRVLEGFNLAYKDADYQLKLNKL